MQTKCFLYALPLIYSGCAGGSHGEEVSSPSSATTFDHSNYRSCEKANPTGLAKAKLFFAHASVGQNIVGGLLALHTQSSSRYPLVVSAAGESPQGATQGGTVLEYDRGNPGASEKIVSFERYVSGGWRRPTVNAVLNKFCYIDPDADFDQYTESMERIVQANPGLTVIFATIPLTSGDDADNVRRETFNEHLRRFVAQRHRYLLDIADIEAHSPSGALVSFEQDGKTCRKLYSGYTTDGGHLNDTGSQAVAKGLVSLLEHAFPGA